MRRYVAGNEIMIPKDDWARLKETYSQDQLVDGLNRLITRYAIAFPLKSPTLEDALADFHKLKRVRAPRSFAELIRLLLPATNMNVALATFIWICRTRETNSATTSTSMRG